LKKQPHRVSHHLIVLSQRMDFWPQRRRRHTELQQLDLIGQIRLLAGTPHPRKPSAELNLCLAACNLTGKPTGSGVRPSLRSCRRQNTSGFATVTTSPNHTASARHAESGASPQLSSSGNSFSTYHLAYTLLDPGGVGVAKPRACQSRMVCGTGKG
jgi:hypothetical protein